MKNDETLVCHVVPIRGILEQGEGAVQAGRAAQGKRALLDDRPTTDSTTQTAAIICCS